MSTIESTTPGVAWTAIRDAAVAAATRGRPVPGTYTRGVTGPAPTLGAWPSVTYREPGHGVPLPPSDLDHTPARWHVRPPLDEPLTLPPSTAVQAAVIDALGGGGY